MVQLAPNPPKVPTLIKKRGKKLRKRLKAQAVGWCLHDSPTPCGMYVGSFKKPYMGKVPKLTSANG
jgi:hypothetical protein